MEELVEKVKFNHKGVDIELELTDEFKKSVYLMNKTNDSFFLTGKAGTGKSTILSYFSQNTSKNIAILSFTGLAAINVGGSTIHSFFKFPLGFLDTSKISRPKPELQNLLQTIDTIIIDEVSMVRADVIDAIDKSLRVNRNNPRPFGGIQMILIGDLHQLPPIVSEDVKEVYYKFYDTPYFFSASVFEGFDIPYVVLKKAHRQKDLNFVKILNSIRERKNLDVAIPALNKRVGYNKEELVNGSTVCLTTTNKKCDHINDFFMKKLETQSKTYYAEIKNIFDKGSYPNDAELKLKVGAKVMTIRNNNEAGYVNGDIGIIKELHKDFIVVEMKGRLVNVERQVWEKYEYEFTPKTESSPPLVGKKTIGTYKQLPIKLAWAITMHKSQGQTYEKVYLDFNNGTFASGQAYVALSRCKTFEGLSMKRELSPSDIILDWKINQFYDKFKELI